MGANMVVFGARKWLQLVINVCNFFGGMKIIY